MTDFVCYHQTERNRWVIQLSGWLLQQVSIPFDKSLYLEKLHAIMEKEREG
ncbi:hypothetical protein [Gracilibacillus thailandensis]|uniref:hypothetical protein n=1 Tax=Gracilibacillus thailandensis TaxID=563735 RepID=UPI0013CF8A86|nr:hypothetical protein [Gracilibacillus thailandensis]